MVRRKVKIPNVVRGGIAIPLNKDNMFLMKGRKHSQGGIDIGNNPRTGMEVEDGEVMQLTNKGAKVFSAMPLLNGQSPANKVLNGQNPNKVFNSQESFKRKNNINNDGSQGRTKAATGIFDTLDEYADKAEGAVSVANLASSGAALVAPNPVTLGAAYLTNLGGAAIDIYQLGRALYKGDTASAIKNGAEIGLSLVGARALKNFKKLNALDKYKKLNGIPQQQINTTVGRKIKRPVTITKEQNDATNQLVKSIGAQGASGASSIFIDENKHKKNIQQNNKNKYKTGGYRSSNNIRRRIAKMEGSSMKTNRAFDLEDRDFYNAIPGNVRSKLNQDALDNLYSYSYNVGAGAFKRRVVPALTALTNGTGTVKAVQDSMYASKDKQLRGLRIRRNIEKQGFADAYNRYNNINNTLANTQNMIDNIQEKVEPPVVEQDNTYVQKPIEIKGIEMPKKQKKYNNEVIKLGMNMLNNKVKYSSTFAAGGRKNTSTGEYSQIFATGGQQKKKPINRIKQLKDWIYNRYSSPVNVKNNNAVAVRVNNRNKIIPQSFNGGTLPNVTITYKRKNTNINNVAANKSVSQTKKPVAYHTINKRRMLYKTTDGTLFNDKNAAVVYETKYKYPNWNPAPKAASAPKAAPAPKKNNTVNSTVQQTQPTVQYQSTKQNNSTTTNANNRTVQKKNSSSNINRPVKKQVNQSTNKNNTNNVASTNNTNISNTNYKPYNDTVTQKKIDELNKMKKDNAEFDRKYNALSKSEQLYVHAGKDTKDINKRLNDSYYKHPNNYIVNRNSISPFARNNDTFDIKTDATNLSNKVNRDLRRQAISDYNKRQINKSDAIGLASNVLGSVISGMINDRMLSSMKYPSAPVRTTAAKLKTNYNINPQLDALRENLYNAYQSINDSTNSSQVALARRQRYASNNTLAANGLYGNKENQQAQLINQDKLNQQQNAANNVAAYNQWNQNRAAFENNVAEKRAENNVGILQNINAGIQDVLARREQRQHDNNTIKAMLAANPNVTPEYFGHYGLNLYRFGGKRFNCR